MSGDSEANGCPSVEALERVLEAAGPPPELARHLDACPDCQALAEEIRANSTVLDRLRSVNPQRLVRALGDAAADRPLGGDPIEGYEILSVVNRGGQGVVYRALQKTTKRTVALKVLAGGDWATPRERARFEREIELAGGLRHAGIVTVHDGGATRDGRAYLVMEYVEGRTLDQWIADEEWRTALGAGERALRSTVRDPKSTLNKVLGLFVKICDGVGYAHQRGVIHRDLKPANVILDAAGEPRILDFGLAKALGAAASSLTPATTVSGEFQGTPAYAAPEQLKGDAQEIDTRTDVYALGVILYEMLTGGLPHAATGSIVEIARRVLEQEPQPPSRLNPRIDAELETIVLKALAREKDRRYQAAAALRQDVLHYLAGEPVEARRDSTWYLLRKAVRRHRGKAALAAASLVVLMGFAVAMSVLYGRAQFAEQQARERAAGLAAALSTNNIERARLMTVTGNIPAAEDLLWGELFDSNPTDALPTASDGRFVATLNPAHWALWELYHRNPCVATVSVDESDVLALEYGSAGRNIIIVGSRGGVHEWDLNTLERRRLFELPGSCSDSGATLSADARRIAWRCGETIEVWGIDGAGRLGAIKRPSPDAVWTVSGDGQWVAAASGDGSIRLWSFGPDSVAQVLRESGDAVRWLRFAADHQSLIWTAGDGVLSACDVHSGECREWQKMGKVLKTLPSLAVLNSDGSRLATLTNYEVSLHDLMDGSVREVPDSRSGIHVMQFSPVDAVLVTGSGDKTVRFWDSAAASLLATYGGHVSPVGSVAYAPDGRTVVSSGGDVIKVWDAVPRSFPGRLASPGYSNHSAAFSPSGQLLATAASVYAAHESSAALIQLWDVASRSRLRTLEGHTYVVACVAFSPDGATLASAAYDGTVRLWNVANGRQIPVFNGHLDRVYFLAFSPDGRRLISGSSDTTVRLWDVATGECVATLRGHSERIPCVAFSPDGRTIASSSVDKTAILWDAVTGEVLHVMSDHKAQVRAIAYSPDGKLLATGGDDWPIRFWDVATGQCVKRMSGHRQQVFALAFSPDGRLLASGDRGGMIHLWDMEAGRNLATMETDQEMVLGIAFSPDGRTLASAGSNNGTYLWDLTYYDRHIAGNLEHQLERLGIDTFDPDRVARLRAWAAEVQARPWPQRE